MHETSSPDGLGLNPCVEMLSEKSSASPDFKSVVMQGKLAEGYDRRLKVWQNAARPPFWTAYTLEKTAEFGTEGISFSWLNC